MIVSTRPPRLSKPISMVVDIKLSLTISDIDNYVFFRTIQPQFLHNILINIRRITAFSSFKKLLTCKRLSPCLRMTGTVRKAILLCACSCSVRTYWTCFPLTQMCQPSPPGTQELLSSHEVTGGVGPCTRQFHTLCSKHMSHQGALSRPGARNLNAWYQIKSTLGTKRNPPSIFHKIDIRKRGWRRETTDTMATRKRGMTA